MDYDALSELLFPNIKDTPEYYENKYGDRELEKGAMVTRFAPSPTGFVHMGSLYVAFLNRLMVDQNGGVFYLRIEDTDHKREVEDGIKKIEDALNYFNLITDESPFVGGKYGSYIQSERKLIYQTYVKDMIKKGLAYPCFCTEEELEDIRKKQEALNIKIGYHGEWARCRNLSLEQIKEKIDNGEHYIIRLKAPYVSEEKIECVDLIKGSITFPVNDMDIVLIKSDGLPTYHLAHVIDDHLMGTTHVIRGDEWLSSLPIHLQLFAMLNFKTPNYAHISPLTKKDGNGIRKLSKRKDPECDIKYYQALGIPVKAIQLYFASIINSNFEGWLSEHKDSSIKDFTFSFSKMPVGGTLFDIDKLTNICRSYLGFMDINKLYSEALKYYKEYDVGFYNLLKDNKDYACQVLNIEHDNIKPRKDIGCYKDIKTETWYMFDELFYDMVSYEELLKNKNYDYRILDEYLNHYLDVNDDQEAWFNHIKELANKLGYASQVKEYKENPGKYKGHVGDICEIIRVALTGRLQTPNILEIQKVLGRDRIKERFANFKKILLTK